MSKQSSSGLVQPQAIFTGPKPAVPFSPAVQVGHTVYVSGMVGLDMSTMKFAEGGAAAQARQALVNLGHVLTAADLDYSKVVKTTILLENMEDYIAVNDVYKTYFQDPYPARTCFQVAKLPLGAKVEIEAIAVSKKL